MSLYQIFLQNNDRIIHKWPHYFPIYERYFNNFINKSIIFFEFGVYKGGSIQMWKKYFGPYATIVGIDINPSCKSYEEKNCHVRIGDQSDKTFLKSLINEFGKPDIVLDDASHKQIDMYNTFSELYPLLNNNGVYMVEDTHTCYWENFGGGLHKKDNFIEKAKELVDTLNAYHFMKDDKIPVFTRETYSISFYDSIVVFEKMLHGKPYHMRTGQEGN